MTKVPSITDAQSPVEVGTTTALSMVNTNVVVESAEAKTARMEAIAKANTEAVAWLRETYRSVFNEKKAALVKAAGYDWTPAMTAGEKAAVEVEKLLAEYPELRERFTAIQPTLPVD